MVLSLRAVKGNSGTTVMSVNTIFFGPLANRANSRFCRIIDLGDDTRCNRLSPSAIL